MPHWFMVGWPGFESTRGLLLHVFPLVSCHSLLSLLNKAEKAKLKKQKQRLLNLLGK